MPGIRVVKLLHVCRDEFRHLEHADLLLAAENGFECVISIDERLFLGILKVVLLDVVPEVLCHLAAWQRL